MTGLEPVYAKCNKSCGHRWYVKHFSKDKQAGGVEHLYFTCPNCGHVYTCYYTDADVRKLQAKLRETNRRMKWANDTETAKLLEEESVIKKSVADKMEQLKVQHAKQ